MQQRIGSRIFVDLARGLAVVAARFDHLLQLTTVTAERRQERMSLGQLLRFQRLVALQLRAPRAAGLLTQRAQVTVILLAGTEQEQVHLDALRKRRQHVDVERRQGRDTEQAHALGQARDGPRFASERLQEARGTRRDVARAVPRHQRTHQARLPVLGLALLPLQQPLGAIGRVLIEEIGQPLRERDPAACMAIIGDVRGGRRERRVARVLAQQGRNAEHQACRVIDRAARRIVAEHGAEGLLDQLAREREMRIGPHAQALRQLHGQPALHAGAGHGDPLGLHGVTQGLPNDPRQRVDQAFHAV